MSRRSTAPTLQMVMDTSHFNIVLDGLEDRVAQAIRPSAQAAAQVFYDAVKENVSQIKTVTGNLNRSIYQAYSPEQSEDGVKAVYRISWNWSKAPHGGLVEGGHLQRYRYYQNGQGQVLPMVRPGMDGKKRPGKRASRAEKDAYYVTLPTPKQVAGKFFLRRAFDKQAAAEGAAINKLYEVLLTGLTGVGAVFGTEE